MRLWLSLCLVSCAPFLSSCDVLGLCDYEEDPNCEDPSRGQITGTVTVPEAGGEMAGFTRIDGELARAIKVAVREQRQQARETDGDNTVPEKVRVPRASTHNQVKHARVERFRAGEVIVKALEPVRQRKAEFGAQIAGFLADKLKVGRVEVGLCGRPDRCVVHLYVQDKIPLPLADTQDAAVWLAQAPFLKYAEKNLILQMEAQPNDEFYSLQWHYAAIDAQAAWDITTGDPSRVAAIVDTGILVDHPDLKNRVVDGADLISDEGVANDGDGRDMDGDDPGDEACGSGCHSFHGSHVAGTIGAETDNGLMVSGITWEGALLPVRVLGVGGGSLSDIADGIYWAAGFTDIEGVDDNPTPADVLNMSLGGQGTSELMNEAVADAAGAGTIVLVAAGNEDTDASESTPANAPDAITVAAVGNTGPGRSTPRRASYSNYGDKVDIAAPGGEQAEDVDNDGQGDGVLSTVDEYVSYYQGTSMATPHVAGIAMLLKSVDPTLTQEDVRTLLKDSSNPDMDCPEGCGAGRVSAAAALLAAQGGLDGAHVVASPSVIRVGKDTLETPVVWKNLGNDSATLDIESPGGPDRDACSVNSGGGAIDANGGLLTATVTIARSGEDRGECTITATWDSQSAEVRVVWTPDVIAPLKKVDVGALSIKSDGSFKVRRIVTTSSVEKFEYKLFNLEPGNYLVIGLVDANNNDSYDDPEDGVGIYFPPAKGSSTACTSAGCGHVTVKEGKTLDNADFVVAPGFSGDDGTGGTGNGGLGEPCSTSEDCGGGLYCDVALPGGYCTTDCFDDTDCSDGLCFPLVDGDLEYQVCLKSCTDVGDCNRSDGYICDSDSTCYPG